MRKILVASASKRKGWFKSVPASIELGKWLIDTAARSDRFMQSNLRKIYYALLNAFPTED